MVRKKAMQRFHWSFMFYKGRNGGNCFVAILLYTANICSCKYWFHKMVIVQTRQRGSVGEVTTMGDYWE